MGRKKRRSSKFKDSSTVIDMEQARQERQQRQQERQEKRKKMEAKNRKPRSGSVRASADAEQAGSPSGAGTGDRGEAADAAARGQGKRERYRDDGRAQAAEPYSPQMSQRHDRRRMALRRRKRNRNLIIAGVLALLLVVLLFSFGNIIVLKHDLYTAEKEQQQYIEEKEQLEKDMAQINDRENLEEQARDQMRLIMPGETLYIFPEDMTEQSAAEDSEQDDKEESEKKQEKQEQ